MDTEFHGRNRSRDTEKDWSSRSISHGWKKITRKTICHGRTRNLTEGRTQGRTRLSICHGLTRKQNTRTIQLVFLCELSVFAVRMLFCLRTFTAKTLSTQKKKPSLTHPALFPCISVSFRGNSYFLNLNIRWTERNRRSRIQLCFRAFPCPSVATLILLFKYLLNRKKPSLTLPALFPCISVSFRGNSYSSI